MKQPIRPWLCLALLGIIVAIAIVLWPLSKPGFYISDDGEWMIIRLTAFFQSLREGQFPVRFLGRLNHSYGYPVANFLYPGFLYLGSLFHLFGFSFVDSVKVILALSVLGAGLLIFFWLRENFDLSGGLLGSLSFIFNPYLLFDLYRRGSVGEVLAMLPASLGFYAIATSRSWLFPVGVGMLLISHNSLGLLFLIVFVGYIVIADKKDFWWPLILGVGLAAFFWLPAWFERSFVRFEDILVSEPAKYFAWGRLFYLLGLFGLIAFLTVLLAAKHLKRSHRQINLRIFFLFLYGSTLFLATPLSSWFWSMPILAKLFQFPYRFLAINVFAGAWLVAEFKENLKNHYLLIFLWLVILVIPLREGTKVQHVVRPESYYTTNEATTTVRDEYLPRWVIQQTQERSNERIIFYRGRGTINPQLISTQHLRAEVTSEGKSELQINSIYYPGWGVLVDNQPVKLDYYNPQGLIRFFVPTGQHRVVAEFRETPLRFFADAISAASILFYGVYLWRKRNNL